MEEKEKELEIISIKPTTPIVSELPKDKYGNIMPKLNDLIEDESFVEIGDILNHKKFGKGEIIDKTGNIIDIQFFDPKIIRQLLFKPELFIWNSRYWFRMNIKSIMTKIKQI